MKKSCLRKNRDTKAMTEETDTLLMLTEKKRAEHLKFNELIELLNILEESGGEK